MISEIPALFQCRRQTMRGCGLRPQVEQPSFRRDGWIRPEEAKSRNVDLIARCTSPKCEAAAIESKPIEGGSTLPIV